LKISLKMRQTCKSLTLSSIRKSQSFPPYAGAGHFFQRYLINLQCLPLNIITLGQHQSDNNNRMIQISDVFFVLLKYKRAINI
jgi:hypothetical protein